VNELLAHLLGDYVIQTDHMAARKTVAHGPAVAHAVTYTLPFLALTRRPQALAVIAGTHFVIDRWRLAKYVVWAKNQAAPAAWRHSYDEHVVGTGYHRERGDWDGPTGDDWDDAKCSVQAKPAFLAVWLLIIADNTLHGCLNAWALRRWPSRA
jgi:hypothetical protein